MTIVICDFHEWVISENVNKICMTCTVNSVESHAGGTGIICLTHCGLVMPNGNLYRSGPTLAQVMACCLKASRHYLHQYWFIVNEAHWYLAEGTIRETVVDIIHYTVFENTATTLKDQWVKKVLIHPGSRQNRLLLSEQIFHESPQNESLPISPCIRRMRFYPFSSWYQIGISWLVLVLTGLAELNHKKVLNLMFYCKYIHIYISIG